MGFGDCWGSLRGPLRENFSFADIKDVAGAAGLPVHQLGHLQQRNKPRGASKGQLIDELDVLFAKEPSEVQDRIATATVREMHLRVRYSPLKDRVEDQLVVPLAAHGWGVRSGEVYRLQPPGKTAGMDAPPGALDYRAAMATTTGVNEIPMPFGKPRQGRLL